MIDNLAEIHFELPQLLRLHSNEDHLHEEEKPFQAEEELEENPFANFNPEIFDDIQIKNQLKEIRTLFKHLPFEIVGAVPEECPICYLYTTDLDVLECSHKFCHQCLKLVLKDYLGTARVFPDEIKCPTCEQGISDQFIIDTIGQFEFKKFTELRKNLKVDKLIATGKAKYCPIPTCNGYVHIVNGIVSVACAVCYTTICPECFRASHPNLTCEEYKAELGDSENELQELMMSRNWKRCPFCSSIVEKVDDGGCNHVRCYSNICKGSPLRCLCYLCGKGLQEKHHFSHFQINGPFGETCNTIDGIEDEPLEEENQENNPDAIGENWREDEWDEEEQVNFNWDEEEQENF